MTSKDKMISQYKTLFNKSTNFMYDCRPFGPSRWINESDLHSSDTMKHFSSINSRTSLFNLLQENERRWMFTDEALTKTYPFKSAFAKFKKTFDDNVDARLASLKKSDFFMCSDEDDCLLRDCADKSGEEDLETGVVPQFIVYAPFFLGDDMTDFVKTVTDDMHFYGCYLARSGVDDSAKQKKVDGREVKLQYMTFEAKFAHAQFEMSEFMYHVAPLEAMKKIATQGLVPRAGNRTFNYPASVYLFNNIDMSIIVNYGISKSERRKSKKFALMKVSTQKLKSLETFRNGKLEFFIDQKIPSIEEDKPCALFTCSNVPAKVIEDDVIVFTFDENDIVIKKDNISLNRFKQP